MSEETTGLLRFYRASSYVRGRQYQPGVQHPRISGPEGNRCFRIDKNIEVPIHPGDFFFHDNETGQWGVMSSWGFRYNFYQPSELPKAYE